jgi:hypothetical protein
VKLSQRVTQANRLLTGILEERIARAAAEGSGALLREIGRSRGVFLARDDPRRALSHTKMLNELGNALSERRVKRVLRACGGLTENAIRLAAHALAGHSI